MDFKLSLVVILTLHSLLLSALISIGQLIANRKMPKNWYFLGLFFVLTLFQIQYIFYEMKLLEKFPFINIFPIIAIYLLGPLIYFLSKHALQKNFKADTQIVVHLLPLFIASIGSVFVLLFSKAGGTSLFSGYAYNTQMLAIMSIGSMSFYVYLILAIRLFYRYYIFSKESISKNPPALIAFVIIIFFVLAGINDILATISQKRIFMELSVLIMSLIIIYLFLINFRYPDYHKILYVVVEKERRSYLTGLDLNELSLNLYRLMDKEEIYLDENISLPMTAEKLNITSHQLSQFLNEEKGESFNAFINRNRIKRAQRMLSKNPDQKILGVAYDVGFHSKSSFNSAFTKFTGITPVEYKRKQIS